MLSVFTIVAIATFRMKSIYVATTRIELDRENANILPFQGTDPYEAIMDQDYYIETQSKILTSETLALQTIRNNSLSGRPEFSSPNGPSEAVTIGSLANQKRPPELGEFLGSLSVKRVPSRRLMDVSFESTDPQLAARTVNAHITSYIDQELPRKFEATTPGLHVVNGSDDGAKVKVQKGRRRAHRLRTAEPDLDTRRQAEHHRAQTSTNS
jgi:uncharacterized protein involved in exopolysaccharide biosynthesis